MQSMMALAFVGILYVETCKTLVCGTSYDDLAAMISLAHADSIRVAL